MKRFESHGGVCLWQTSRNQGVSLYRRTRRLQLQLRPSKSREVGKIEFTIKHTRANGSRFVSELRKVANDLLTTSKTHLVFRTETRSLHRCQTMWTPRGYTTHTNLQNECCKFAASTKWIFSSGSFQCAKSITCKINTRAGLSLHRVSTLFTF